MDVKSIWSLSEAAHLLNRAGFGGTPEEIRTLHERGQLEAVESFFSPKEDPQSGHLPKWTSQEARSALKERLMAARAGTEERQAMKPEDQERSRSEVRRAVMDDRREQTREMRMWWLARMCSGTAPLQEKMTLFWHDHFATSIEKVKSPVLMFDQNQLFRKHALGNFKTLTRRIVEDPAMMIYLDTANSRPGKPNENFARELMELFTLGEGHYSEADVKEAARAFTGYRRGRETGRVRQLPRQFDSGMKTLLGESGRFDAGDVVDVIFRQERCAVFLAEKLWHFFADEHPPAKLLNRLAGVLREGDYEVAPLLRAIFLSPEFYAAETMRSRIKSPVEYLVQLVRQLELPGPPDNAARLLQQMGQVLFAPPNVAGWDWGRAWINTNTLLTRYSVAGLLSSGGPVARNRRKRMRGRESAGPDFQKIAPLELRESPEKLVGELCFRLFQGAVPDKQREAFEAYATVKLGAAFTDREVAELLHLIMSTPYYQLT